MKLKDKIIDLHLNFKKTALVSDKVDTIRNQALKEFERLGGFPTNKLEAWKYTSLASLLDINYTLNNNVKAVVDKAIVERYLVSGGVESYNLVFVDGFFNADLSDYDANDAVIVPMDEALISGTYSKIIDKYYNTIAKTDNLTALNTAFTHQGVFIHVSKSKTVTKPIQILHISTGNSGALFIQPRNLVVTEPNAHVKVIERHQSISSVNTFTNSVTEIYCDKDATVDYYKIQDDKLTASLIDNTYIDQKSNTECSVHTFSFGGNVTRNNLNFYQNGEHINSILKGVTILEKKQHVDHYTLVHHIEPNCESHQDYKGIYDDNSVGVFNGKVFVEKEAQKTDAYQQNDNVLLTNKATINAKPQLEIFADDVKCSHGCTIGQLDESALFYMQQRGIPKKEANGLLMFAFANSVLESVKISSLKDELIKAIAKKLKVDLY